MRPERRSRAVAAADVGNGSAAEIGRGRETERRAEDARYAVRHDRGARGLLDAQAALANQGSINEPLFLSPAQHFVEADQMEAALAYRMPSWTYSRIANPTVHYLEETLGLLETLRLGRSRPSACGTGVGDGGDGHGDEPVPRRVEALPAAEHRGDGDCYGGTLHAVLRAVRTRTRRRGPLGARIRATSTSGLEGRPGARGSCTAEMPSNPALAVFDIPAVAELAHRAGVPLIVDSDGRHAGAAAPAHDGRRRRRAVAQQGDGR